MVIKGEIGNKKDPIQAGPHHLPVSDLHLPSAFCKKTEVLEMGSLVQLNCISFITMVNTCHTKRKLDSRMGAQDRLPAKTVWHFLRDHIMLRLCVVTVEFSAQLCNL